MNRRTFLRGAGVSAAALTLVPRHVLGGAGQVAPSEKITMALIGCGTQGLRELPHLLDTPEVQVVAVCDPNRDSHDYVDWSKDGLRKTIAATVGNPQWRANRPGIPGGREVAREMVDAAYARQRGDRPFKGCRMYADFRELLDQEKDLQAVKVMTPDHLHAAISVAAMKKGRQVLLHKPLANRVLEARWVIETARKTGVATHFLPAGSGRAARLLVQWVKDGAIGKLRALHNWSNRPVWPQYATIPTDTPPVPPGFDWDLWLGPSQPRPYHPHYTHAVFRGWYEFSGGALADMGHYSLWHVFQDLNLGPPTWVESTPSHLCTLRDQVSVKIDNDYAFPAACTIRFHFAEKGTQPAFDLYWYDGGMRPPLPEQLVAEQVELPPEGMMWVGDEGIILAGFLGDKPRVWPAQRARNLTATAPPPSSASSWIQAFKGGPPTDGNFLLAGPISEAFNLAAVSLRLGGRRLLWDAAHLKITNRPEANKHLSRDYRKGWEPGVA